MHVRVVVRDHAEVAILDQVTGEEDLGGAAHEDDLVALGVTPAVLVALDDDAAEIEADRAAVANVRSDELDALEQRHDVGCPLAKELRVGLALLLEFRPLCLVVDDRRMVGEHVGAVSVLGVKMGERQEQRLAAAESPRLVEHVLGVLGAEAGVDDQCRPGADDDPDVGDHRDVIGVGDHPDAVRDLADRARLDDRCSELRRFSAHFVLAFSSCISVRMANREGSLRPPSRRRVYGRLL